jgi:hypothetical protein
MASKWYNIYMNSQLNAVTTPYSGKGGRRPRAGRPAELQRQLKEAKALAAQMRVAVRSGLLKLADDYPALLEIAVNLAMQGDTKVLLHLLELPAKMGFRLDDDDSQETPMAKVAAEFRMRLVTNMNEPTTVIDAE